MRDTYGIHEGHINRLLDLNPLTPVIIPCTSQSHTVQFCVWLGQDEDVVANLTNINYVGLLGHNLASAGATIRFSFFSAVDNIYPGHLAFNQNYNVGTDFEYQIVCESILQWGQNDTSDYQPKDGTFLIDLTDSFNYNEDGLINPNTGEDYNGTFSEGLDSCKFGMRVRIQPASTYFTKNITIGALSFGTYYDMPHAPDMDISMRRSFEGVVRQKTLGGSTVTNTLYTGAPKWTIDVENRITRQPFSCSENFRYESSEGRREWDLNWSSLFDHQLFSPNEDLSWSQQSNDLYTILVSKTLGWQLPFIFEYNTSKYTSPDSVEWDTDGGGAGDGYGDHVEPQDHMPHHFAIARLKEHEVEASRIAPNLFNIDLSIAETW